MDGRKRKITRRRRCSTGVLASEITLEQLSRWFHLPSHEACKRLGVSLSVLKRICRQLGIARWPYNQSTAAWQQQQQQQQQLMEWPPSPAQPPTPTQAPALSVALGPSSSYYPATSAPVPTEPPQLPASRSSSAPSSPRSRSAKRARSEEPAQEPDGLEALAAAAVAAATLEPAPALTEPQQPGGGLPSDPSLATLQAPQLEALVQLLKLHSRLQQQQPAAAGAGWQQPPALGQLGAPAHSFRHSFQGNSAFRPWRQPAQPQLRPRAVPLPLPLQPLASPGAAAAAAPRIMSPHSDASWLEVSLDPNEGIASAAGLAAPFPSYGIPQPLNLTDFTSTTLLPPPSPSHAPQPEWHSMYALHPQLAAQPLLSLSQVAALHVGAGAARGSHAAGGGGAVLTPAAGVAYDWKGLFQEAQRRREASPAASSRAASGELPPSGSGCSSEGAAGGSWAQRHAAAAAAGSPRARSPSPQCPSPRPPHLGTPASPEREGSQPLRTPPPQHPTHVAAGAALPAAEPAATKPLPQQPEALPAAQQLLQQQGAEAVLAGDEASAQAMQRLQVWRRLEAYVARKGYRILEVRRGPSSAGASASVRV